MSKYIKYYENATAATSDTSIISPNLSYVANFGTNGKLLIKDTGTDGDELEIVETGTTDLIIRKRGSIQVEFVDLGLSVLWGKWDLGASAEGEYGKYYAWGDTTGYASSIKTYENYVRNSAGDITVEEMNYYCWTKDEENFYTESETVAEGDFVYEISTFSVYLVTRVHDNMINFSGEKFDDANMFTENWYGEKGLTGITESLSGNNDAATVALGNNYRMPSETNVNELLTLTHEVVTVGNHLGMRFTSTNGNSIFIPFAGYGNGGDVSSKETSGNIWVSTYYDSSNSNELFCVNDNEVSLTQDCRYYGFTIRPVCQK